MVVVCNNTLAMALESRAKEGQIFRQTHRTQFNPELAKQALGLAQAHMQNYKEAAEFLGSKRYTPESLKEYFGLVFPHTGKQILEAANDEAKLSRTALQALEIIELQPGAKYAEGSWWQAINSVTYITDHLQSRNADNRLYSAWYGGNKTKKLQALDTALKMAQAA